MVPVMIKYKVADPKIYEEVIILTGQSLLENIKKLLVAYPGAYEAVIIAGREAYAMSYKYVYYVSIGEMTFFLRFLEKLRLIRVQHLVL